MQSLIKQPFVVVFEVDRDGVSLGAGFRLLSTDFKSAADTALKTMQAAHPDDTFVVVASMPESLWNLGNFQTISQQHDNLEDAVAEAMENLDKTKRTLN